MKILALDYGTTRIGVAVSDINNKVAFPREYIKNTADNIQPIRKIIIDEEIEQIIVGYPKSLNNNDTKMSIEAKNFYLNIQQETKIQTLLIDERLSSKFAEKQLIYCDTSRKDRKQKVDSIAASFFLQGYLDKLNQKC